MEPISSRSVSGRGWELTTSASVPTVVAATRLIAVPAVIVLWFLLVVDGSLVQSQLYLTGGRVPFPAGLIKPVFGLAVVLMLLGRTATIHAPRALLLWALFVAYIACHAVYSLLYLRLGASEILLGYNTYYFALLFMGTGLIVRGVLPERPLTWTILLLSLPLVSLGILQHVLVDTLLAVRSEDEVFSVTATRFFGEIRAYSLFRSVNNFGHYMALVTGLATAYWLRAPRRLRWLLMIGFLSVGVYSTLKRAVFLQVAITIATVGLGAYLSRRNGGRLPTSLVIRLLPVVFAVIAALIIVAGPSPAPSDTVLSQTSLLSRFAGWRIGLEHWLGAGGLETLFGTGRVQNRLLSSGIDVAVDNIYLAVGSHLGLVGGLVWLALMWSLWVLSVRSCEERATPLALATMGVWASWMARGIFSNSMDYYGMFLLLALWTMQPPVREYPSLVEG